MSCWRQLGSPARGNDDDESDSNARDDAGTENEDEVGCSRLQHDSEQTPERGHPQPFDA